MTMEDGALWLCSAAGLIFGWWWRGRAERKARADDLPQWMAKIGHGLAAQFHSVDEGHRFAGDDVEVLNRQTYEGGGKSFVVVVRRKAAVTIDL